ncbi:MAG: EscU/YscU/HrcU family type III secretion system export apparatus switch protein [Holophagaceae bacterium]|nr:EscU/YscU/HrcU family type III secretion system export apparatus switch protein [Holophagaceae bacterium]
MTNPTHVAVALRYDERSTAPICVAKGLDHLALKIREKAREAGVPILERPTWHGLYRIRPWRRPFPGPLPGRGPGPGLRLPAAGGPHEPGVDPRGPVQGLQFPPLLPKEYC